MEASYSLFLSTARNGNGFTSPNLVHNCKYKKESSKENEIQRKRKALILLVKFLYQMGEP